MAQKREVLMTAKSNDRGILLPGKQTCLDIHVSLDSQRQALLVTDAPIKASGT